MRHQEQQWWEQQLTLQQQHSLSLVLLCNYSRSFSSEAKEKCVSVNFPGFQVAHSSGHRISRLCFHFHLFLIPHHLNHLHLFILLLIPLIPFLHSYSYCPYLLRWSFCLPFLLHTFLLPLKSASEPMSPPPPSHSYRP